MIKAFTEFFRYASRASSPRERSDMRAGAQVEKSIPDVASLIRATLALQQMV
jgi:hypothetical protein